MLRTAVQPVAIVRPAARPAVRHLQRLPLSRAFLRPRRPPSLHEQLNTIDISAMRHRQNVAHARRQGFLWAGLTSSILSFTFIAYKMWTLRGEAAAARAEQAAQAEARRVRTTGVGSGFRTDGSLKEKSDDDGGRPGSGKTQLEGQPGKEVPKGAKTVIRNPQGGPDLVETGEGAVKHFPSTILLPEGPDKDSPQVEYTLVGLGVRSVTFLYFHVYVVGLYVATQDVPGIRSRLLSLHDADATAAAIKTRLDDSSPAGDQLWESTLFPARTAFRIVPTRETNFPHLRDGFVRAITARRDPATTKDDAFGQGMRKLKHAFTKGKLPLGSELMLQRDTGGIVSLSYVDSKGSGKRVWFGEIDEPRITSALWLNYLSGKVASPLARESIVAGMLDMAHR